MYPAYSGPALYNEIVEVGSITLLCEDCKDENDHRLPGNIEEDSKYLKGIVYSQLEDDDSDFYELEVRGQVIEWINAYACLSETCIETRRQEDLSYDAARAERH